jgi:hypothetical protein
MTSGSAAAARALARGRGVAAKASQSPSAGATNSSRSPPVAAATPSSGRRDTSTAVPILISAGGALGAAASFATGIHLLGPPVYENVGKEEEEEDGRHRRNVNRHVPHEHPIYGSVRPHLYLRVLKAFQSSCTSPSWIYQGYGNGSVARCEEREDDDDSASEDELLHRFEARYPTGYAEPERFAQALEYHRSLLFDYLRRWEMGTNHHQPTEQPRSRNHHHHPPQPNRQRPLPAHSAATGEVENHGASNSGSAESNIESSLSSTAWPRHVPNACDVPALEFDLKYCLKQRRRRRRRDGNTDAGPDVSASAKSSNSDGNNNHHQMAASSPTGNPREGRPDAPAVLSDVCQNVQFRVATYYLSREGHNDDLRRGLRIVKELAEQGHPDGMCLYGTSPRACSCATSVSLFVRVSNSSISFSDTFCDRIHLFIFAFTHQYSSPCPLSHGRPIAVPTHTNKTHS